VLLNCSIINTVPCQCCCRRRCCRYGFLPLGRTNYLQHSSSTTTACHNPISACSLINLRDLGPSPFPDPHLSFPNKQIPRFIILPVSSLATCWTRASFRNLCRVIHRIESISPGNPCDRQPGIPHQEAAALSPLQSCPVAALGLNRMSRRETTMMAS
jgi:hypothetical protein